MLVPWKKSYDQPRQWIKSKDITLLTKVCTIKTMIFPVVMYGCESWTIKNVRHQRIELCFWTVVPEKTLESLLDSKEIKTVNPKGNQPRIFIGRLMLKVKLQYFGHLMQRTESLVKTLLLGEIEGRRRRWNHWIASPRYSTKSIEHDSVNVNMGKHERWWRTERCGVLQSMGSQRVRHDLATEQQQKPAGQV